jgi:hypothetical protein
MAQRASAKHFQPKELNHMTAPRAAIAAAVLGLTAVLVVTAGCGNQPFTISNQKIVRSVSAQGKPGESTNLFTTQDKDAYCYFEYRGAPSNLTLRGEIIFNTAAGSRPTRSVDIALKPGNGSASFGVECFEGETLEPGSYEAQLYKGSQELFGSPLQFQVQEAPKTTAPGAAPDAA